MRVDIVSLVRKWYDNDVLDILVDKLRNCIGTFLSIEINVDVVCSNVDTTIRQMINDCCSLPRKFLVAIMDMKLKRSQDVFRKATQSQNSRIQINFFFKFVQTSS